MECRADYEPDLQLVVIAAADTFKKKTKSGVVKPKRPRGAARCFQRERWGPRMYCEKAGGGLNSPSESPKDGQGQRPNPANSTPILLLPTGEDKRRKRETIRGRVWRSTYRSKVRGFEHWGKKRTKRRLVSKQWLRGQTVQRGARGNSMMYAMKPSNRDH